MTSYCQMFFPRRGKNVVYFRLFMNGQVEPAWSRWVWSIGTFWQDRVAAVPLLSIHGWWHRCRSALYYPDLHLVKGSETCALVFSMNHSCTPAYVSNILHQSEVCPAHPHPKHWDCRLRKWQIPTQIPGTNHEDVTYNTRKKVIKSPSSDSKSRQGIKRLCGLEDLRSG